jgi:putative peptidoglycan lipid II flippase
MQWKFPKFLLNNTDWLERQQNSILSAAVIITIATGLSTLSGLFRQRILLSLFLDGTVGAEQAFEAFLIAFQIPDTMFQLIILGAISASFIPIFTSLRKNSSEEAFQMTSTMMNVLLLAFTVLGVGVAIFAEPLTALRTGEAFTAEQVRIVANLTRIMLVAQVFFAISNFLSGMLQSYQRFVLPSLAPVLYNLGIVAGVFLFKPYFGIYSAGIGVILGAFIHMAIQLPLVFKLGFRFKPSFNLKNPSVRRLFRLMPPRLFTLGFSEFQNLALGFFATTVGNFSFVVIRLALTLMTIPIRLFGVPISQASLPFLSEESDEKDLNHFKRLVIQSLHQIAFLALPASVLLLILRVPIVRLAFGTQNFQWPTTLATSRVVAIIALSIAAQAMAQLLTRAFHALKDTKTPLYITVLSVILYVGLCALTVFALGWGLYGMALATSLSAFLELAMLVVFLNRKIHGFLNKSFWIPQIKMTLISFLMAVFLYLPFRILDEVVFDTSRTLELIALTITTSTIGMLVYLYFAALFEIKELQLFLNLLSSFGRWQKPLSETKEAIVETPVDGDSV